MADRILYSLCIPTYNRPECVRRLLENLCDAIPQAGLAARMEVCISDNNEDDRTRRIVNSFISKGTIAIRYAKNRENLGYARNAIAAISLATGEYVHLNSDEGQHRPEVLQEIVECAQVDSPDVIFLFHKSTIWNSEPGRIVDSMLSEGGIRMGFGIGMGTFIISRRLFRDFLSRRSTALGRFCSRGMVHLPLFLHCLKASRRVSVLDSLVRPRSPQAQGKVIERTDNPKIDYPGTASKIYINHYFFAIKDCLESGIISAQEDIDFVCDSVLELTGRGRR